MWTGGDFRSGSTCDGVDSDQSISEEDDEDLDSEYRGNTICLGATADKSLSLEVGMQVLSQLEILKDSCKPFSHEKERFSPHERKSTCSSDDEVENPLFEDEDGSTRPPRFGSASHSIQGIMHLPAMASNSHCDEESISDGEESCSPILGSGAAAYSKTNKFTADSRLSLLGIELQKRDSHVILAGVARKDNAKQNLLSESLDCLYDNFPQCRGNPELVIRQERHALLLGDGISDDDEDELPHTFDGTLPNSSDDEENPQRPTLAIPMRTMADQFCEAFGTVSGHVVRSQLTLLPKPLCSSSTTYGKMQSVIQAEKEQDVVYLKHTSAGTCSMDERNSIKVRILSRCLEAKLVACSCAVIGDRKFRYSETKSEGVGGSLRVIFNPRICSNVEIEVDSVICIHSPWKEVQVNGKDDEVVLLSSYYCHNCH